MYPEVLALSRNSSGELSTIIAKVQVTMESSRQVKEEAHDATEDFQSEVLDLSTKQIPSLGPSSTLSGSPSLSSPPPPQSKRRRMDPDSDCPSSRESSDFCLNRTHKTFTDATLDCDVFHTGGADQFRHLESISPSSTDDEARMGTVDSSSLLRAPDNYPSLLQPSMPPLHSLSSPVAPHPTIADRLREVPAFFAGHPLNMAAVAASVCGVNSSLNAFNANCSAGTTLVDFSASADRTTARLASSCFPPSSRRRQKAAPRTGRRWEAAARSPRPPPAGPIDPKAAEDAVLGGGGGDCATGRTTGNGGDRSQSEERDSAYLERRRKNNEAAKRSRDARRHKEEEIAYRAAKLEQENISLRAELLLLRRESAELHHLLYGRMDPQR